MRLGDKPRRTGHGLLERAARQFEDPVADTAVKVVVMSLARAFIQNSQHGMRDDIQSALGQKQLQIAIDRGQVQGGHAPLPDLKDFLYPQRVVRLLEYFLNRHSLGRIAFHYKDYSAKCVLLQMRLH